MRIITTGPPHWRREAGFEPDPIGDFPKISFGNYQANKAGQVGLVSVFHALNASTWAWLRWTCNGRAAAQ